MKSDMVTQETSARWTPEKVWAWQRAQQWRCGFNYLPASAVNSTEMWQAETFDLPAIERELNWAKQIGFNSCRVFLQYLVWEDDPQGLLTRLDQFLQAAHERGLTTILILFDDCAFAGREPYLGPQDAPVAGVHNSGWTPSPGRSRVVDEKYWLRLREYVQAVIGRFQTDPRVHCWDLYNEPGNNGTGDESLPLLQACFAWAREIAPSQPLTTGVWNKESTACDEFVCKASDILSFHEYTDLETTQARVAQLQSFERPLLCTEWMSRTLASLFQTHLPYFHSTGIGCYFWGLSNGRTQTHWPWGSLPAAPPPELWFHDLLDSNGQPHRADELELIRRVLARTSTAGAGD